MLGGFELSDRSRSSSSKRCRERASAAHCPRRGSGFSSFSSSSSPSSASSMDPSSSFSGEEEFLYEDPRNDGPPPTDSPAAPLRGEDPSYRTLATGRSPSAAEEEGDLEGDFLYVEGVPTAAAASAAAPLRHRSRRLHKRKSGGRERAGSTVRAGGGGGEGHSLAAAQPEIAAVANKDGGEDAEGRRDSDRSV